MSRSTKPTRNAPSQGCDLLLEDIIELAQADNADWEDVLGVPLEETDMTMRAARAMKHATGHENVTLFRFGYMLYIVTKHTEYTLDDLKRVIAGDWDFPDEITNDPDILNDIRDMMFYPCYLIERTSDTAIAEFYSSDKDPSVLPEELKLFVEGYGPDGTLSIPWDAALTIPKITAIMCAEIWCVWASRNQSSLPPHQAFVELFGPEAANGVKEMETDLRMTFEHTKLWEHLCLFYKGHVGFLTNYNAFVDLTEAI